MDPFHKLLQTAVDHHNAGRLAEAESIYRWVLARKPDHPDALRLLGDIAVRMGGTIATPLPEGAKELVPYLASDSALAPTGSKPLVLGAAFTYKAKKVAPFVRSLRAHYSGDAVFLVDTPQLIPFLDRHGIRHRLCHIDENAANFTIIRHAHKLEFLEETKSEYGRVLFTDIGDVIFQGDPLSLDGPELVTFEEDRRFAIGTQPKNASWMQRFFGDEILDALKDKPIVCGGITLGCTNKMISYLRVQLALLCGSRQDRTAFFGIDQATHNFIAHMKLIDGFEIRENYGHCTNLGLTDSSRVRMDANGVIRVDDKPPSPIVHQYNYVKGFAQAIDRRYASDL